MKKRQKKNNLSETPARRPGAMKIEIVSDRKRARSAACVTANSRPESVREIIRKKTLSSYTVFV